MMYQNNQNNLQMLYAKRDELVQKIYMNNNINPTLGMRLKQDLDSVNKNIYMLESMQQQQYPMQQQYQMQPQYQQQYYGNVYPQYQQPMNIQQQDYQGYGNINFGKPMPSSCNNNGSNHFAGIDAGKYADSNEVNTDTKYAFASVANSYQNKVQSYNGTQMDKSGYERELQEELKMLREKVKEMETKVKEIAPGYILNEKIKFFTNPESSTSDSDLNGVNYLYPVRDLSSYTINDKLTYATGRCESGEVNDYIEASSFILSNVNYDPDFKDISIVALLDSACSKTQLVPVPYKRDDLTDESKEEMADDVKQIYELFISKIQELDPSSSTFFRSIVSDTLVEIEDSTNTPEADVEVARNFSNQFHKFVIEATKDYVNVFVRGCLGLGRNLISGKFTVEDTDFIDSLFDGTNQMIRLTGETLDQAKDFKRFFKDFLQHAFGTITVEYSKDDEREIVVTILKKCRLFGVYIPSCYDGNSIDLFTNNGMQEGIVSLYSDEKLFNIVDTLYRKASEDNEGIFYKEDAHLVFTDGIYNEVSYQIIPSCVTVDRADVTDDCKRTYFLRKVSSRF